MQEQLGADTKRQAELGESIESNKGKLGEAKSEQENNAEMDKIDDGSEDGSETALADDETKLKELEKAAANNTKNSAELKKNAASNADLKKQIKEQEEKLKVIEGAIAFDATTLAKTGAATEGEAQAQSKGKRAAAATGGGGGGTGAGAGGGTVAGAGAGGGTGAVAATGGTGGGGGGGAAGASGDGGAKPVSNGAGPLASAGGGGGSDNSGGGSEGGGGVAPSTVGGGGGSAPLVEKPKPVQLLNRLLQVRGKDQAQNQRQFQVVRMNLVQRRLGKGAVLVLLLQPQRGQLQQRKLSTKRRVVKFRQIAIARIRPLVKIKWRRVYCRQWRVLRVLRILKRIPQWMNG